MTTLPASLCIVAGGGVLPKMVADHVGALGVPVFMVMLEGHADRDSGFPHIIARPEHLGRIFNVLHGRNIADLVLIGRMTRPRLRDLRPDWATLRLLPRILWALCFGGDDALLRAVRAMLERQGFRLHAAQDFVEDMTAPVGVFSARGPEGEQLSDIRMGIDAARAHGAADLGQGIVILNGQVVAQEDANGTDAMIMMNPAQGAVLVKMAKPQQDRALDLPSIGPDTVCRCVDSGYAGIAVEAGATLVAERDIIVTLADRAGLFLIGVK